MFRRRATGQVGLLVEHLS